MKDKISIEIFQEDWIPGFGAFLHDGAMNEGKAHVVLNIGGLLGMVEASDVEAKELPYIIAETLMHEVIHVFEAWAGVEFSEDRVEALLEKYGAYIQAKADSPDEGAFFYEPA